MRGLVSSAILSLLVFDQHKHVALSFTTPTIIDTKRIFMKQQTKFALEAAQILEFQEPKTNTTVMLVGCMHYNPSSVKLVRDTIQKLHDEDRLGPVIVESCDIRWNKTEELYKEKPMLKNVLENEMRTACDLAKKFGQPVILGDQRINITTNAMKETLKETVLDLLTPPSGWKRFITDVSQAWSETVPLGGKGYLNAFAFIDPRLLLALPVSLVKYPLSFLIRDPLPTSVVLTFLVALSYDDPTTLDSLWSQDIPLSDYMLSTLVAVLETVVFARLLLKPLLAERNQILASSILKQCELVQRKAHGTTKNRGGIFGFLENPGVGLSTTSSDKTSEPTMYAPGSILSEDSQWDDSSRGKVVVVAVLGMAHCNGIKKVMNENYS
jgi:hypothetical protein